MSTILNKLNEILDEKTTKIIPENIKAGVTVFGVNGNLSPQINGARIFSSKEEMMNDNTHDVGDIALVYGGTQKAVNTGMAITNLILKSSFELDQQLTENTWLDISSDDYSIYLMGSLRTDRANLDINFDDGESISIQYTTNDGIHYTTTSEYAGQIIELNSILNFVSRYGDIDENFFKFIETIGMYLEGVYEYVDEKDDEWFDSIIGYNIDDANKKVTTINEELYLPELTTLLEDIEAEGTFENYLVVKANNNFYLQCMDNEHYMYCDININTIYHGTWYSHWEGIPKYTVYSLDLEHQTYSYIGEFEYERQIDSSRWSALPYLNGNIITKQMRNSFKFMDKVDNGTVTNQYFNLDDFNYGHISFITWHHVKTEFDLEHPYQLVEGVTALGKHGPITGDGTVYEKIDWVDFLSRYRNNVDVLMSKSGKNGYHAEKLLEPTEQSIMEGNFDVRVLHNLNIQDYYMYNSKILLTKYYILVKHADDILTVYDYMGNVVATVNNADNINLSRRYANCWLEIDENTLGYIRYVYNTGTYFYRLHLDTGVLEQIVFYDYKTNSSNIPLIGGYDNDNDEMFAYLKISSTTYKLTEKNGSTTITSDIAYGYSLECNLLEDSNYYYAEMCSDSTLQFFVFDKVNKSYIGKITDLSKGAVVFDKTNNRICCTSGTEIHVLNGTSHTKLYDISKTIGGSYTNHAGYLITDNNNNPYFIGNGIIENLTTHEYIDSINYGTEYNITFEGKVSLEIYNDKVYLSTHRPEILITENGDDILLECEKNTLIKGYSEYALIENNAFSHI